jgi:MYXO-CTERM domain-containing protein
MLVVLLATPPALSTPGRAAPAAAERHELLLAPAQDASIYQGDGNVADGAGPHVWISVLAIGTNRRAMLRFDFSAIPPGAVIEQVALTLYQSRSRDNHDATLHRMTASWSEGPANGGEGGVGVPARAGDVTWTHRRYPDVRWAVEGGEFIAAPSATTFVGFPDQSYTWQGPGLVADVQHWVDNPAANHGWMLIGKETGNQNAKRLGSRQNPDAAQRPVLRVVWSPAPPPATDGDVPLPPWALGLLAAGLAATLARRRKR